MAAAPVHKTRPAVTPLRFNCANRAHGPALSHHPPAVPAFGLRDRSEPDVWQTCHRRGARAPENRLAQGNEGLAQAKFLTPQRGRTVGLVGPVEGIGLGAAQRQAKRALPFTPCVWPGGGDPRLRAFCHLTDALPGAPEGFTAARDPIFVADPLRGNDRLTRGLRVAPALPVHDRNDTSCNMS